mmetsp:Transcript_30346/g.100486  ORF Transcript_30346/g.100486 Transcript_30346/m.100486 type:complete len:208 (-) Transcript_30346:49-672(-)
MGPHRRRPHQPQPGVRSQPLPQNRARAASATPRPRQEPLRRMWAPAADANHADAAAREAAGPQRAGPVVAALALVAALAPHFAAARPPAARFASLRVCHSHRLAADPTEHDLGEGGPRPSAHCPSAARTAADGAGPTPAHDGALCLLRAAGRGGPGHLIALCMCVRGASGIACVSAERDSLVETRVCCLGLSLSLSLSTMFPHVPSC